MTTEEIESIVTETSPLLKCQASLRGGLQGVLVAIDQHATWIPLSDDRDTVENKAKEFARMWAEGDQPK